MLVFITDALKVFKQACSSEKKNRKKALLFAQSIYVALWFRFMLAFFASIFTAVLRFSSK